MRRLPTLLLLIGVAPLELSGQAIGDTPGLHVDAREEYYALDDPTLGGVIVRLNSMRLEGDGTALSQGLTRYRVRPSWRPVASGGRCRVAALGLRVEITVTLPAWSEVDGAPESERSRWEHIAGAIREHEYAHRDLTLGAAEALLTSLGSLEARGCTALRRAVAAELALADARLTEAHEELDRTTPSRLIGPSR